MPNRKLRIRTQLSIFLMCLVSVCKMLYSYTLFCASFSITIILNAYIEKQFNKYPNSDQRNMTQNSSKQYKMTKIAINQKPL